jgi:SAM-dependent methyltransferase
MSTAYQAVPSDKTAPPSERIRAVGKKMGLWNHGFDFPRSCNQLFHDIDFNGKNMLEIGCGKGILCLWAALHGADEVVGLEPLAEGAYDSSECHRDFESMARQLGLPQAKILPLTVQQYTGVENHFDIVLSMASINHLDEKACVKLQDSPDAVRTYQDIFRGIARTMKAGGKLIIVDAARHNFFGDLGVRNPMTPNIEWFKHQQPEYWVELLQQSGFGNPRIRWASGRLLRYAGLRTLPKRVAYFGQSVFHLELTRIR